jgi:S1-C subfamily serine protease
MATFEIGCPQCRARFECPAERAGRGVRCGACAHVFTAPPSPPAAPPRSVVAKPLPAAVALPPRAVTPATPRPSLRVMDAVAVARPPRRKRRLEDDEPPPRTSPLVYVLGGVGGVAVLVVLLILGYFVKSGSQTPEVAATTPAPAPAAPQPMAAAAAPVVSPPADSPLAPVPSAAATAPATAPPPPTTNAPAAIARVKDSTAYIRVHSRQSLSMGSGFFAGPPGYVVTNAHVIGYGPKEIEVPSKVEVVVHSGEADQRVYAARIVGYSVPDDLALIWVNAKDHPAALPPPLPFGATKDLVETQEVLIFGFPLGEQLGLNISVNKTTVSSLRKKQGVVDVVQVAGGMTHGNSGGPVANTRGEVIGVSVAGIEGTDINFAIPGDTAAAFMVRALPGKLFDNGDLRPGVPANRGRPRPGPGPRGPGLGPRGPGR